jgi:mannosyl-3-phosphoglycerate phosphatase
VYSNVDGVLRNPTAPAFSSAAGVLNELWRNDAALVFCSSKTRAELEFVQQKLDIAHPFICENGGAVIIPNDYFHFDLPNARSIAGRQAIEFGRTYDDVADVLHRTADRLGLQVVGFRDMSIEEVAKACQLPLLQARLAKLREYEEPFRLIKATSSARSRLFRALDAASLRGTPGALFDRVGAPVEMAVGVNLLNHLYRREHADLTTIGVVQTKPDDGLLRLVDHSILVVDADADEEAIGVLDWAEAIIDSVKELRERRTTLWSAAGVRRC